MGGMTAAIFAGQFLSPGIFELDLLGGRDPLSRCFKLIENIAHDRPIAGLNRYQQRLGGRLSLDLDPLGCGRLRPPRIDRLLAEQTHQRPGDLPRRTT